MRVYRSRRDQGWVLLALAAPCLAVGVGLIPDGGWGVACCGGVMGATVALGGAVALRTRVGVGPGGVVKRPRVPGGFRLRWDAVEWWAVVDLRAEGETDSFSRAAVRFAVGWRRYEVREADVHRPGFAAFLADVRTWAGNLERDRPA